MNGRRRVLLGAVALLSVPGFAVESVYLDSLPITYPGEYLAPPNLYLQVPPPTGRFVSGSLAPATVYESDVLRPNDTVGLTAGSTLTSGYAAPSKPVSARTGKSLRVLLRQGLDHASDVPLAVLREHLVESAKFELVSEGEDYDALVEVETMRLDASPVVFIVVNAYKDVEGEQLIFFNHFGYLSEMKLLSGSASYASKLESALAREADRLDD